MNPSTNSTAAAAVDRALPGAGCCNVVVTGGSRGIGRAVVEGMAARGHRVLFTYNSSSKSAVQAVCDAYADGLVTAANLDQGNFGSIQQFAQTVDRWRDGRPLDVLVNNAALGSASVEKYPGLNTSFLEIPTTAAVVSRGSTAAGGKDGGSSSGSSGSSGGGVGADANADAAADEAVGGCNAAELARRKAAMYDEALMRVNSLGPLWVTEALLPQFEPETRNNAATAANVQTASATTAAAAAAAEPAAGPAAVQGVEGSLLRASVLFLGSVGGGSQSVFPAFRMTDGMSKAAIVYAVKCMAAKYIHSPVDFTCICPGATDTDMFRASTLEKMKHPEAFVNALPKSRLIKPSEIAEGICFLTLNPAARIFHGAVIDASQGLAVRPGVLTEMRL